MSGSRPGEEYLGPRWVRISYRDYTKLPRHGGYKFELLDGELRISPRWGQFLMGLDLGPPGGPGLDEDQDVGRVRPLRPDDWDALPALFGRSFARTPPFELTSRKGLAMAGRDFMRRTREGEDGPVVEGASMVAEGPEGEGLIAAFIVTLTHEWEFGGPVTASPDIRR
jgi:hypothetical protein